MRMKKLIRSVATLAGVATFTACSNDDTVFDGFAVETPSSDGPTYTMAIEAVKGGEATTRALSVGSGGTTLDATWATTDNIYVKKGSDWSSTALSPDAAGTSATLRGTLSGITIAAGDVLTLQFPKNGSPTYTGQKGTLADIAANFDYATATVKVKSITTAGDIIPEATTTTFQNQQAIVKFTLQNADGTTPLSATELTVSDGTNTYTVTPASATSEIYVAIPSITNQTVTLTATVGSDTYTCEKANATFTNGKYYAITVKMAAACPALGDLYYSDGTYSTTLQTGKTPIGVIAYLGTDNFTENGTTVNGSTFVGHGLVLCLKNAASGIAWSTETSTLEFGDAAKVTDATALKRTTNVSGYTNTKTLAEKTDAATKYPAAYQAKTYTGLTAPTGTTGWFLPSAQQWVKMQTGLGALSESSITWYSWFDTGHTAAVKWENALKKAGDGNYDSMTSAYLRYWSSSEYSAGNAVSLHVDATDKNSNFGFWWYYLNKGYTYSYLRVRPVLAF